MTSCSNCENKENRCYCPPNMECSQYKPKTPKKVTRVFLFKTNNDWTPTEGGCWIDCPFSPMIKLGDTCKFIKEPRLVCPLKKSKEVDIR